MDDDGRMQIQRVTGVDPRAYHITLPRLALSSGLDPYEVRLLAHYYGMIGMVYEKTVDTARHCCFSAGKVSETRRALADKGWLSLTIASDGVILVDLVDRSLDNVNAVLDSLSESQRSGGSDLWNSLSESADTETIVVATNGHVIHVNTSDPLDLEDPGHIEKKNNGSPTNIASSNISRTTITLDESNSIDQIDHTEHVKHVDHVIPAIAGHKSTGKKGRGQEGREKPQKPSSPAEKHGSSGKKKSTVGKEQLERQLYIRREAERRFEEATGLKPPGERSAAGARWWGPLRQMCELANWDAENVRWLIDASVKRMRGLTIGAPQSILKTAISIARERRADEAQEDRPWTPFGYKAPAEDSPTFWTPLGSARTPKSNGRPWTPLGSTTEGGD